MQRRVLIVEDHDDARATMRVLLEMEGHIVQEAADGPAGIQAALHGTFDVAFVDLGLPGVDGYAVARGIRASAAGPHITLVALTGYGNEQDRRNAAEAGFDLHLVKPVDPQVLIAVLDKLTPRADRS